MTRFVENFHLSLKALLVLVLLQGQSALADWREALVWDCSLDDMDPLCAQIEGPVPEEAPPAVVASVSESTSEERFSLPRLEARSTQTTPTLSRSASTEGQGSGRGNTPGYSRGQSNIVSFEDDSVFGDRRDPDGDYLVVRQIQRRAGFCASHLMFDDEIEFLDREERRILRMHEAIGTTDEALLPPERDTETWRNRLAQFYLCENPCLSQAPRSLDFLVECADPATLAQTGVLPQTDGKFSFCSLDQERNALETGAFVPVERSQNGRCIRHERRTDRRTFAGGMRGKMSIAVVMDTSGSVQGDARNTEFLSNQFVPELGRLAQRVAFQSTFVVADHDFSRVSAFNAPLLRGQIQNAFRRAYSETGSAGEALWWNAARELPSLLRGNEGGTLFVVFFTDGAEVTSDPVESYLNLLSATQSKVVPIYVLAPRMNEGELSSTIENLVAATNGMIIRGIERNVSGPILRFIERTLTSDLRSGEIQTELLHPAVRVHRVSLNNRDMEYRLSQDRKTLYVNGIEASAEQNLVIQYDTSDQVDSIREALLEGSSSGVTVEPPAWDPSVFKARLLRWTQVDHEEEGLTREILSLDTQRWERVRRISSERENPALNRVVQGFLLMRRRLDQLGTSRMACSRNQIPPLWSSVNRLASGQMTQVDRRRIGMPLIRTLDEVPLDVFKRMLPIFTTALAQRLSECPQINSQRRSHESR